MKQALLGQTTEQLAGLLAELGEKPFRARQVCEWLNRGVPFEQMSNLPAALRETLRTRFDEGYAHTVERLISQDGTRKYLFALADGNCVESVLMRYEYGNTVCISTQAGCAMGCAFCASCKGGLIRNLTAGEILAQVVAVNADLGAGRNITNVVLMGTGEPLANYDNTVAFLRRVNSEDCLHISCRNISLSTCGLAPQMHRFAKEGLPVTLCLSLHAAFEQKRAQIMPVAQRYSIQAALDALAAYAEKTGRRVVIEYIVIDGFNCAEEDARQLQKLLGGMLCHINLIALNAIPGSTFLSPPRERVYAFCERLNQLGLSATVRRSLGADIFGACGQLRARHMGQE